MAIKTVIAMVNGTEHTLVYNSATGRWEKTINAPNITSFNLNGGYYPVTIKATNEAGTSTTVTANQNNALKLVVKEKVKPVITLLSPTNGAYISNSQPTISFNVVDEANGSGINSDTISLKIDNVAITGITKTAISNGYNCSYTSASALSDGSHTITITANDNDGNSATQITSTFKIDTVPPVLNITAPQNNLITANSSIVVSGKTNDTTSSPVTILIKVNNVSAGDVSVNADGTFTKTITLVEGNNSIIITATDKAGKTTTVTIEVVLDTSVPVISDISINPNPVDAGATMIISAVIE